MYATIYQAFIDIRNLSELLSEQPDIVDVPDAVDLPLVVNKNAVLQQVGASLPAHQLSSGASVEFRNIGFHYPEQPPAKGLKHVDFFVRPGTTTAIVGHTGAGDAIRTQLKNDTSKLRLSQAKPPSLVYCSASTTPWRGRC